MKTLVDELTDDQKNDDKVVEAVITDAYQQLFSGNGGEAAANTVLVDLMGVSGWGEVMPEDATHGELASHNGARRVVGRILFALSTPPERVLELQEALQSRIVPTEGLSYE